MPFQRQCLSEVQELSGKGRTELRDSVDVIQSHSTRRNRGDCVAAISLAHTVAAVHAGGCSALGAWGPGAS